MAYTIQIHSYLHSRNGTVVTVSVPRAVQVKYDNMVRLNLHLVLVPDDKNGVEIMVVSEGIQLDQDFVEFEENSMVNAIQDIIDDADPPALLKLKKANLEARAGSVRVQ